MQGGGRLRPATMKSFIPLSEDFYKRQQQYRSAVMADIIGHATLGHFPQDTIASDLALRYGGLPTDFLVAAYHNRDYVIMLPQWVRPADLIGNGLVHLGHCRLRCFDWDPLRNARPSQLSYKARIKLFNLPFEAWSVNRVAAVVSGFGRFLRADESSINMAELSGFKCIVAVNDLTDIPEQLDITLGDVTVAVRVILESSAPFGGDDRGIPFSSGDPSEGDDQTDPLGRRIARRVPTLGADIGESSIRAANRSDPSWDSSEIRDRRRGLPTTGGEPRGGGDPVDAPPVDGRISRPTAGLTSQRLGPLVPGGPRRAPSPPRLGAAPLPLSCMLSNSPDAACRPPTPQLLEEEVDASLGCLTFGCRSRIVATTLPRLEPLVSPLGAAPGPHPPPADLFPGPGARGCSGRPGARFPSTLGLPLPPPPELPATPLPSSTLGPSLGLSLARLGGPPQLSCRRGPTRN